MTDILFFDTETGIENKTLREIGAVKGSGETLRTSDRQRFLSFASDCRYLAGHNILAHDLKFLEDDLRGSCNVGQTTPVRRENTASHIFIDTLYLSPLMFPTRPYHRLVKDDKLLNDDFNNPLSDAAKAKVLFEDEVAAFLALDLPMQRILCGLLRDVREFSGFFRYLADSGIRLAAIGSTEQGSNESCCLVREIQESFRGRICANADIGMLAAKHPAELAYCLALINADDRYSAIPPWVARTYPRVQDVMNILRNTPCNAPCKPGCSYCEANFGVRRRLKDYFGYDSFRTYKGEPLQEQAVSSAVAGKSLLAVFPTGGGKSLTFQLPALIAGDAAKGLTVVISPLQSLMKDQVDNLTSRGVVGAVTINGSLDPVERMQAVEQVENGVASILYISPESLRSATIERLLRSRNVVRFVIDEAHCFSAWGQDFRVDYLYIGEFIRQLSSDKHLKETIPVSCFTATARQKVIADIRDYFRITCGLELELLATDAERTNLRYEVLYRDDDEQKYQTLRELITARNCPTLVYVSRTRRTRQIADRLTHDGISALPYHGKMPAAEKQANQEAFMSGQVDVIVATTAFGMGIDKDDVGLVIHYNISASLEDYVQEAGRAGRDPSMDAECIILFNEDDLDKHFRYLSETRLSLGEIRQIWKAVKKLSSRRDTFTRSALEIARAAGWEDATPETETKVRAAISALEQAGYIRRGRNVPHIYASGITVRNMADASERLQASANFSDEEKQLAARIMTHLIGKKYRSKAGTDEAESRVDYIADKLGERTESIMKCLLRLREDGLIDDSMDMTVYTGRKDRTPKTEAMVREFAALEQYLIDTLPASGTATYKELNSGAAAAGIRHTGVNRLRAVLAFWMKQRYIRRSVMSENRRFVIERSPEFARLEDSYSHRINIALFIVKYLGDKTLNGSASSDSAAEVSSHTSSGAADGAAGGASGGSAGEKPFSVLELENAYNSQLSLLTEDRPASGDDIMLALAYLKGISAMDIDGGFLVLYNAMQIERIAPGGRKQYRREDYSQLDEYYSQRMQQIHIAGEFARLMTGSYQDALDFASDYFSMDYMLFIRKYFKGKRRRDIDRSITPERYNKLFQSLSPVQRRIIDDDRSKYIVVAAGPGSGKTRVLVHKLASLLMLEDVRSDQLLMLTFSRAAATEFRQRLCELIGTPAYYVDIRTFHAFCFDIAGEIGSLESAGDIVKRAADMIRSGAADEGRITRSVLVIDEAQDMDEDSFALVRALMARNEDMRIIAVGDDDQNIYEFRNSDSRYMRSLITDHNAKVYELTDNYRSDRAIAELADRWVRTLPDRMKTETVTSVSGQNGCAVVTRFCCRDLTLPLLEMAERRMNGGSCCIMTRTNEEALLIAGMLRQRGIRAHLIQSNDDFDLRDLAEIRAFTAAVKEQMAHRQVEGGRIPRDVWNTALSQVMRDYSRSACLDECAGIIETYADVTRSLYLSDYEEYLKESSLSDFMPEYSNEIIVSTIHKTKGREFDSVYMMLSGFSPATDAEKRAVYVGITRAKHELYIACNTPAFEQLFIDQTDSTEERRYSYSAEERPRQDVQADPVPYTISTDASGRAGEQQVNFRVTGSQQLTFSFAEENAEQTPEIRYIRDRRRWPQPDAALLQLSHRGVNLSYFRYVQGTVRKLRSGDELILDGDTLYACPADRNDVLPKDDALSGDEACMHETAPGKTSRTRPAARLSRSALRDLQLLKNRGFEVDHITVRFTVWWKDKDDGIETLIILPDIALKRK